MKKIVQELKYKEIALENVFNWSFDILKLNVSKIIPSIILIIILGIGSKIFVSSQNDFYSKLFAISYGTLEYFTAAVVYAGLMIGVTNLVENSEISGPFNLGKKIFPKIFFYSTLYFTFIFFIGLVIGVLYLFLMFTNYLNLWNTGFLAVIICFLILALLIFLNIKLSFLKNIYYTRGLGIAESIKYSFHSSKGYTGRLLITKIIFYFIFFLLNIALVFSGFINLISENIWISILGILIQAVLYFIVVYLMSIKVYVISLFYLNAEYNDLKISEKNNKTIE